MSNIKNIIEFYADTIEEAVGHKKEFLATIENFEKAVEEKVKKELLEKLNEDYDEKIKILKESNEMTSAIDLIIIFKEMKYENNQRTLK